METLGKIERVNPRSIWANEAADFTPWLSENLGELGEALGLELELKSTEAAVGDFSLDILARDLGSDKLVVIENQLSPTDHDHLGKLITYASGFDASTVIWIAPEIRDEHRQALDWLNGRSDQDTEFFGVMVEVLRIGGSTPAVQFRPVAAPNDWRKSRKSSAGLTAPSPRAEKYREFFQELIDELRESHRFTNARKASAANWCMFASGVSGLSYNPSFAHGRRCRAELYIDVGDEQQNRAIFDHFFQRKDELVARYGTALEWDRIEGKRACRIAIYRSGSIEDSPEQLQELRLWFIERMLKLKAVFGPHIPNAVAASE